MALPLSGQITLSMIQAEFGGTNPAKISEYYRGGVYVANTTVNLGVPTSGQIAFSDFYGASATFSTVFETSRSTGTSKSTTTTYVTSYATTTTFATLYATVTAYDTTVLTNRNTDTTRTTTFGTSRVTSFATTTAYSTTYATQGFTQTTTTYNTTTDPSISKTANSVSTTANITIPSAAAVGDIALLIDSATSAGSIPTSAMPSGFTLISNNSFLGVTYGTREVLSYKILQSGDPGSSVTGMTGGTNQRKVMVVFTPSSSVSSVSITEEQHEATAGDPVIQETPFANYDNSSYFVSVYVATAAVANPTTFNIVDSSNTVVTSNAQSDTFDPDGNGRLVVKLLNGGTLSPGQKIHVDMDDEGNGNILKSLVITGVGATTSTSRTTSTVFDDRVNTSRVTATVYQTNFLTSTSRTTDTSRSTTTLFNTNTTYDTVVATSVTTNRITETGQFTSVATTTSYTTSFDTTGSTSKTTDTSRATAYNTTTTYNTTYSEAIQNITMTANATTTGTTITIPAAAQAGDVAVLFAYARGSGSFSGNTIGGWTTIANNRTTSGSSGVWGHVQYKILASGDPGTSVGTVQGAQEDASYMLVFRPDRPVGSITLSTVNGYANVANPPAQTIAGTGATIPYVALAHYIGSGTVVTRTSNVTMTEVSNAGGDQYLKYKIYNVGGTAENISIDKGDDGDNVLQSWYMQFNSAGVTDTTIETSKATETSRTTLYGTTTTFNTIYNTTGTTSRSTATTYATGATTSILTTFATTTVYNTVFNTQVDIYTTIQNELFTLRQSSQATSASTSKSTDTSRTTTYATSAVTTTSFITSFDTAFGTTKATQTSRATTTLFSTTTLFNTTTAFDTSLSTTTSFVTAIYTTKETLIATQTSVTTAYDTSASTVFSTNTQYITSYSTTKSTNTNASTNRATDTSVSTSRTTTTVYDTSTIFETSRST